MLQKTTKLLIALPFIALLIIGLIAGGVVIYSYYKSSESRDLVVQASMKNDPSSMNLTKGANSYIRRAILKDRTECGIVKMNDGAEVKYWFRSHHLSGKIGSDDLGTSRFIFPGGRERIVSGYFCCEVMFPQKHFESTAELDSFLAKVDGVSP